MEDGRARLRGELSVGAGVVWLLLWFHQAMTHGISAENEERVFLEATWMDSGKLFLVPFLMFLGFVVSANRTRSRRTRLGGIGFSLTVIALAGLIAGVAIQFWTFPFGSYELSFEESPIARTGGLVQSLATIVFLIALIPFGIDLARQQVIRWWMFPILVITPIGGFFLTPATFIPGVGWIVIGAGSLSSGIRSARIRSRTF